ncbi:MAG: sensor histidine kinase [Caldilineales bacterium]|nr:sensor histidine kinase [Caldilineales bacterium]
MKSPAQPESALPPETRRSSLTFRRVGDERIFMIIVVIALGLIYAFSVLQTPALQQPLPLVVFTILMLLYTALFALPMLRELNRIQTIAYLIVQMGLAFVLMLITSQAALAFGIVAPLIGMSMGMLPLREAVAAVLLLLLMSALAVTLRSGWAELGAWPLIVIPLTLFIVIYVALYGRQAAARADAQALALELDAANSELAAYAEQVEALTLADERQRMARELHDTLAQGVAGLILQLEAVQARLEMGDAERAQAIVGQAMVRARSTLAEARAAIDDLREPENASRDLADDIEAEVLHFRAVTSIPCHLELTLPADLPDDVQTCAHTAVAEGLANAARHAHATEAWVSVTAGVNELSVEVRDNGVGFDANRPMPAGHYGLMGLRERAGLLNGSVIVRSLSGQGTTLTVRLPLNSETAHA